MCTKTSHAVDEGQMRSQRIFRLLLSKTKIRLMKGGLKSSPEKLVRSSISIINKIRGAPYIQTNTQTRVYAVGV